MSPKTENFFIWLGAIGLVVGIPALTIIALEYGHYRERQREISIANWAYEKDEKNHEEYQDLTAEIERGDFPSNVEEARDLISHSRRMKDQGILHHSDIDPTRLGQALRLGLNSYLKQWGPSTINRHLNLVFNSIPSDSTDSELESYLRYAQGQGITPAEIQLMY